LAQQLNIRLSPEATKQYLKVQQAFVEVQVNADLEPSGKNLQIEFGVPFDEHSAYLGTTYLGEATVEVIEE